MEIEPCYNVGLCQCNVINACVIKKHFKDAGRHIKYRKPWRCSRTSVYAIDGIRLCAQHAGKVALNHLLRGQVDEQN